MTSLVELASGQTRWPAGVTAVLAALAVTMATALGAIGCAVHRGRRGRTRVDDRARFLATAADLATMTQPTAGRDAARLDGAAAGAGVPIARAVRTGKDLFASWEWVQLHIMGPRVGKPPACACARSWRPPARCW